MIANSINLKTQPNKIEQLKKHLLSDAQQFNILTYVDRRNNSMATKQQQKQTFAELNRRLATQNQKQKSIQQQNRFNKQNQLKQYYLKQIQAKNHQKTLNKQQDKFYGQACQEYQQKFHNNRQYQLLRMFGSVGTRIVKSNINSFDSKIKNQSQGNVIKYSNITPTENYQETYKEYLQKQIERKQQEKEREKQYKIRIQRQAIQKHKNKYEDQIDRLKMQSKKRQLQFRNQLTNQINSKHQKQK